LTRPRSPAGARVSVIIPAFNAEQFLSEALASVFGQTLPATEVIVVDDGSRDATAAIAAGYGDRIRYIRQENQGVSSARNTGIAAATEPYVAFLDVDDLWSPEKLESQLGALREAGEGVAVCSTQFVSTELGQSTGELRGCSWGESSLHHALVLSGNVVGTPSTVLCERRLFELVGGFDTQLSQCADWDMWIRLSAVTRFACVRLPLVIYRRHPQVMSRDPRLLETDMRTVLQKVFANEPHLRSVRGHSLGNCYRVLAGSYFEVHRLGPTMRCGLLACWHSPGPVLSQLMRKLLRVSDRSGVRSSS
jgi:glycosyltransferase involved in cell wall biosynthesis